MGAGRPMPYAQVSKFKRRFSAELIPNRTASNGVLPVTAGRPAR